MGIQVYHFIRTTSLPIGLSGGSASARRSGEHRRNARLVAWLTGCCGLVRYDDLGVISFRFLILGMDSPRQLYELHFQRLLQLSISQHQKWESKNAVCVCLHVVLMYDCVPSTLTPNANPRPILPSIARVRVL